jgi:hypothetical protein
MFSPQPSSSEPELLETAEAILALDDRKVRRYHVVTWDRDVLVKPISGGDREDLLEIQRIGPEGESKFRVRNFRARLVSMSLVNRRGDRLFTPSQVDALTGKSDAALQELSEVCTDASKLKPEDIDELAGQLPNAPSEGSGAA